MKFKKRSLAKTFKNTSFRLFVQQPSTGKMINRQKILGVKYKVKIKNADN